MTNISLDVTGSGLTRKEPENHFKYTDDELTDKKIALMKMKELWPDVSTYYAELVYDLCKNTPEEEVKKIMERTLNEPSRFKGLETASLLSKKDIKM